MSISFLKLFCTPGSVITGRWMTAKSQRSRMILFGLTVTVVVGYFIATLCSFILSMTWS